MSIRLSTFYRKICFLPSPVRVAGLDLSFVCLVYVMKVTNEGGGIKDEPAHLSERQNDTMSIGVFSR